MVKKRFSKATIHAQQATKDPVKRQAMKDASIMSDGNDLARASIANAQRGLDLIKVFFTHLKKVGYYPHAGQAEPLQKILSPSTPMAKVFLQCSRNFGKSTLGGIAAVAMAGLYPRTKNYIIGPFFNLTKEIYVESYFLHDIIPPEWLAEYTTTDQRFVFTNGSFIKLDGADNEARVRGYKPHFLVCDEFQDWKKEVWDAMEPNRLAYQATVMFLGTPPDTENVYIEQAKEIQKEMEKGNPKYLWMRRDIWSNPRLPKDEIEKTRAKLIARGDLRVWQREYEALFIPGGARSIYPMFSRNKHLKPRSFILDRIKQESADLVGITAFDPSGTRWGCAGFLHNPVTANMYWVFSIVETRPEELSAWNMNVRVQAYRDEWYGNTIEFTEIYDEAASLFRVEMEAIGQTVLPTQKKQNDKSNNISLVRDALMHDKLFILDELEDVAKEFEGYIYDDRGKINKRNDDLMDCCLYAFAESGYTLLEEKIEKQKTEAERGRRAFTPEEDLQSTLPDNSLMFGGEDVTDMTGIFGLEEDDDENDFNRLGGDLW